MKRLGRCAYWAVPSLVCLAIYWPGLLAWFQQDDFAWLGLHLSIHSPGDFWRALFAPMAQGTIRPWSERVFFLSFFALFGLDALPFRIWVFATQFANLALLASITWRITGSRHAGFWAPVFWAANSALGIAMSWTSAYNQVLCGFFLLLSFHLWLRHIETGRRSYYAAQWVTFLLGFGALEINVVYPALAAGYAMSCARPYLRKSLYLFVPSAAYAWVHTLVRPAAKSGPYSMHFDARIPATLWDYWTWAFGGVRLEQLPVDPYWKSLGFWSFWAVGSVMLAFVVWKLWQRQWAAGFLVAWFVIVIGPVLPLRDHFSDYYLSLPTIGLAALGGWAFASAWGKNWGSRIAAIVLAALYLSTSTHVARFSAQWNFERSEEVRKLVLGVARAHQLHPGKIILLSGVGTDLFWSGVFDKPFRLLGITEVYLAPGADEAIQRHPELGTVDDFVFPPGPTLKALSAGQAVVYSAGGERLRNITRTFHALAKTRWKPEPARRVDVGQPLFADQLGPTWYPVEGGYRWMPKRASVILGGPRNSLEKLYITGFCPAGQLNSGPLGLTVAVDGERFPPIQLTQPDHQFDLSFPLPASSLGEQTVEVTVEVSKIFIPAADGRELGIAFGVFAIR